MRTRRGRIWAARLGLLALALNALVPIHLAFDLAEAFEPRQCGAHLQVESPARHLLALLTGHHDANRKSDEHAKHHACPVCSALGALAAFVPPASAGLSAPAPADLSTTHFLAQTDRFDVPTAYRSRAPPIA
jgi:hypothetical protein